jgi:ribosomal protein L14
MPNSNCDALQTMLNVIDNSGAAIAECVKVLKMKRAAKVGTSIPSPQHTPSPPNLSDMPQATAS